MWQFLNLSSVIALRVQSYHDTLKYNETIISDFIERAQKQLFKFKTFLIGLATLFDHHKESFAFRTNQWTEEWEVRSLAKIRLISTSDITPKKTNN